MINADSWEPTNIVPSGEGWQPNPDHIAPWSKHVTKLEAAAYIDLVETHIQGDVLDVGAGTVPYYGVYAEQARSVTTLDWSDSLHAMQNIDVVADVNHGLPFVDGSFDSVLLADVLEHVHQPQTLMSDIARTLRPGGNLVVFVPFLYGIHEAPHDYHRYTEFALRELCEATQLDVVALDAYGGGPDVILDLAEKMAHGNRIAGTVASIAIPAIAKTALYKRMQEKHKDRFPIGYTLVAQKAA